MTSLFSRKNNKEKPQENKYVTGKGSSSPNLVQLLAVGGMKLGQKGFVESARNIVTKQRT